MIPFLSSSDIADTVSDIAKEINNDFGANPITLVCILKGSFIFCADLIRLLTGPVKIEFMSVSSYEGTSSTGTPIIHNIPSSLNGKNVIVVEDIVDTGICLNYVLELLMLQGPASLKVAALVSKPSRRVKHVTIDYCGFEIEDKFIVGYGLDYNQLYRNLPYIGVLEN